MDLVCFVARALVASGYKWGDLEDTRAALLVHTSKSQMKASPEACSIHTALCEGLLTKTAKTVQCVLNLIKVKLKDIFCLQCKLTVELIHLKSHLALNNTRIVFIDILSISFANNPYFIITNFLIKSHRLN